MAVHDGSLCSGNTKTHTLTASNYSGNHTANNSRQSYGTYYSDIKEIEDECSLNLAGDMNERKSDYRAREGKYKHDIVSPPVKARPNTNQELQKKLEEQNVYNEDRYH